MTVLSSAKINLHLDIGPRRSDGFHELESIFVMIDFNDAVTIEAATGTPGVRIEGNVSVPVDQDLMAKAAHLFFRHTGLEIETRIRICKRIPVGTGLGGGSSNAACVLK